MTLMCNVSGMPTPMVSWMTPYSQRVSGYKLEVRKINGSQAGEYKCEASNEYDNATEMATIIVHCKYGSFFSLKVYLNFQWHQQQPERSYQIAFKTDNKVLMYFSSRI